jgi:hypothetical protein
MVSGSGLFWESVPRKFSLFSVIVVPVVDQFRDAVKAKLSIVLAPFEAPQQEYGCF